MKIALFSMLFTLAPSLAAACNSGPDYCTDDPRIPTLLMDKKAQLAADYPAEFVALLDLGVQCVARISQSPDAFSMLMVQSDGTKTTLLWDADNQRVANSQLDSGQMSRYWIIHLRRAFSCDGEVPYDQRSDYDTADDLNTSLAISCRRSGDCPVSED